MRRSTILSLVIGIVVGATAGWVGHMFRAERDLRTVLVARDLERVSFAVNTLNMQADQPEKAGKLQLLILRSSLENLEELTREKVVLQVKTPALRQGLERAHFYAKANGLPELADTSALVSARLFGGS